jgi:hypothetical protein
LGLLHLDAKGRDSMGLFGIHGGVSVSSRVQLGRAA